MLSECRGILLFVVPMIGCVASTELAQAQNMGCTHVVANRIDCPLQVGTYTFAVQKGVYVQLTNSTGTYLQIDQVQGQGADEGGFGEYGVYLDRFATDQNPAGSGEVGVASKDSGQTYPPIRWDNSAEATGLSVQPNSIVYLNYSSQADSFAYTVTVRPQTTGVYSWRQPRTDQVIVCDGTRQTTTWSGWKNTTDQNYYLRGAQIYAVTPTADPAATDNACLYILDTNGNIRWSMCNGVNRRGHLAVSPIQTVKSGETVAGQAGTTCQSPKVWDWAAFIYMSR